MDSAGERAASMEQPNGHGNVGTEPILIPSGEISTAAKKENLIRSGTPEGRVQFLLGSHANQDVLKETVGDDTLPVLYKYLADNAYWQDWGRIANYIAYGGRNDASSDALMSYIDGDSVPSGIGKADLMQLYKGKFNALAPLGITGGVTAIGFLVDMHDGYRATTLVDEWYQNTPDIAAAYGSPRELLEQLVRDRAAVGLALSSDSNSLSKLRSEYNEARAQLQAQLKWKLKDGEERRPGTLEEERQEAAFSGLVEALAYHDMVTEHGQNSYWRVFFEGGGVSKELAPYLEKYRLRYWLYQH